METRFLLRAYQRLKISPPLHQLRRQQTSSSSNASFRQANPIGDYYASLLESPTPTPIATSNPPATASPSKKPPISTHLATPGEDPGPSILFSSRLSSPLERRSEIQKKSTLLAGVWVPPRPDEPDNCCMSGCVNCVWDRYRDEFEEWAAARKEADKALRKEKSFERARTRPSGLIGTGLMSGEENGAQSMDDDGGRSESNWETEADVSEDLFKGIPVGIREFMKQEKRLKEKHARDGTSGG